MRDRRKLQSTIQLRPEDIDLLLTQVNDPDPPDRNVSGFDNNLTPGREYWGSAEQPFLRLSPAQFEPNQTNPNAVRITSPTERRFPTPADQRRHRPAASRCRGQHDQQSEHVRNQPVPDVLRPVLRSRPRFLCPRRGLLPGADRRHEEPACWPPRRASTRSAGNGLPVQIDLTDNLLGQLESNPQPFEFLIGSRAGRFDTCRRQRRSRRQRHAGAEQRDRHRASQQDSALRRPEPDLRVLAEDDVPAARERPHGEAANSSRTTMAAG